MTTRWMLCSGAVLGALAVLCGAFGAHALEGAVSERALGWFETAVTYHATHALALLVCGLLSLHATGIRSEAPRVTRTLGFAAMAFLIGIALFSGSLYAMTFTEYTRLGMITPLGGVALISGWLALALAAYRLPATLS